MSTKKFVAENFNDSPSRRKLRSGKCIVSKTTPLLIDESRTNSVDDAQVLNDETRTTVENDHLSSIERFLIDIELAEHMDLFKKHKITPKNIVKKFILVN